MAYPSLRFRPSSLFYTTLDATITGATDPILVVDNSAAPDAPGIISIDNEEIYYAVKGVNEFSTLTRGYNDTTATGHDAGRSVACPISTDLFSKLWDAIEYLNSVIPTSLVTAKGDIIAATASGAVDNVAVGADGQALIADSGEDTGLNWLTIEDNIVEETTVVSDATPTPVRTGQRSFYTLTALSGDAEFAEPSGTPINGDMLLIRIKDDETARALTWNVIYDGFADDLPSTTTISKTLYILFIYNSAAIKWEMLSYMEEA